MDWTEFIGDPDEPTRFDLVPCPDCGRQVGRDDEHTCAVEHVDIHLAQQLTAELDSGAFLLRLSHWLDEDPSARLRREYIAWEEAGCPPWPVWEQMQASDSRAD